jgi:hypothetical protein
VPYPVLGVKMASSSYVLKSRSDLSMNIKYSSVLCFIEVDILYRIANL